MEKLNLTNHIKEQLEFFVEKFVSIGWKKEDKYYLTKTVDFNVNPNAANEEYKRKLGVVLFPKLLSYQEEKEYVITPWIACKIEIECKKQIKYTLDLHLTKDVGLFMKEEIKKMGWESFKDEDAFMGAFSTEKQNEYIVLKCYLNKNYPKGWWENHAL